VNPVHLFVGTHDDNMTDMVQKGRRPRGRAHHNARLTEESVREIRRANGESHSAIAARYAVSRECVSQILRGERWGWVTP